MNTISVQLLVSNRPFSSSLPYGCSVPIIYRHAVRPRNDHENQLRVFDEDSCAARFLFRSTKEHTVRVNYRNDRGVENEHLTYLLSRSHSFCKSQMWSGFEVRIYTSCPRALAICMVSASCRKIAICLNKDQHREHRLHFAKK